MAQLKTYLPQNQFGTPSADEVDASSAPPLPGASTSLFNSTATPAVDTADTSLTLSGESAAAVSGYGRAETADIPEIFRVANLLCMEAREFSPDYPSIYQAMLDENAPRALEGDLT